VGLVKIRVINNLLAIVTRRRWFGFGILEQATVYRITGGGHWRYAIDGKQANNYDNDDLVESSLQARLDSAARSGARVYRWRPVIEGVIEWPEPRRELPTARVVDRS
jgi:chromosome condensin MukBEF complex kleisin-like MukF subunit